MGGGVSLPQVPLPASTQALLNTKYEALKASGKDDDAINAEMTAALPAVIVFSQIDCDHSGAISRKELTRMLQSIPRSKPLPPPEGWPDGKAPPFVPIEKMVEILDTDGDGQISLDEWLENLGKLPALEASIKQNVDPATGKLAKYQSLEARLDQLTTQIAELEAAGDALDDAGKEKLAKKTKQAEKLRTTVGTAGVAVFRQIDADGSGKIDRAELLKILKDLPGIDGGAAVIKDVEGAAASEPVDVVLAALDVDGDGVIDVDEWLTQLDRLPTLKAAIEAYVDPKTGLVDPSRNPALPPPDAPAAPAENGAPAAAE